MKASTAAASIAIAVVFVSVGLAGCGSDSKSSSSSTSSAASTSTKSSTSAAAPSTSAQASGPNQTISDYISQNGIQQKVIHHADPGSPSINLLVPDGWNKVDESEDAPYGGIVFATPANPQDPPMMAAKLSLLTGNVDPQQLLALAHGKIKNAKGFQGGEPQSSTVSNFPATQIAGTFEDDQGTPRQIMEKTVVFPGGGGTYLFQIIGQSSQAEGGVLKDAANAIDEQLTITP